MCLRNKWILFIPEKEETMKNRFIIFPVMCILLLLCASPEITKTRENSEMMQVAKVINTAGASRHIANTIVVTESGKHLTVEEEDIPIVQQAEDGAPDPYEVYLMAHLIYGEAGNQNDECQLAVGAVVLNRVKHERYPNTIEEVIFQEGQYACILDGNFDKEPSQQAWDNAYWLLANELSENPIEVIPLKVIYQAQFEQGSKPYDIIGSETFCYE